MAHVSIAGFVLDAADHPRLDSKATVEVGVSGSFIYFFNQNGHEVAHAHADLYPFTGLVFHDKPRVWDDSIKASVTLSGFPSYAECLVYSVGDRVETAHGMGTVEGFESFNLEGQQAEDKNKDNGGRVRVALDNPEAWPCHSTTTGGYYAFRSDLVKGE